MSEDEIENLEAVPKVKDLWKPDQWHSFIDDDDDENYFQRLYKNGEFYESKNFGKIELKSWMLFLDKDHFKDTIKDYFIEEGFAITVLAADNTRYTATCSAYCCKWRIHASRLTEGITLSNLCYLCVT